MFSLAALFAFVWLALRPEVFLIAVPAFVIAAPIALASMLVFFRGASTSTAVVLIPLVLLAVDLNVRPGVVSPGGAMDAQTLAKAGVYALLTIHGIAAIGRDALPMGLRGIFLAYALVAASSTFYADSKVLAAGGGLALVGTALAVNTLATAAPEQIERMWRYTFVGLVAFAAASLLLYLFVPAFAVASRVAGAGRLQGVTGAPNSLGPLMVIGVLIGLYLFVQSRNASRRLLVAAALGLLLLALALTGSRTAIGGLALSIAVCAIAASAILLSVAAVVGLVMAWVVVQPHLLYSLLQWIAQLFARSGQIFELTTFTGRLDIWQFSLQRWLEAPWLGYGLGGPRRVISEGWANRWGVTTGTAHNMFLESLMSVGVIGTLLLFVFVALLLVRIVAHYRRTPQKSSARRSAWLLLSLLVFILIDGLMEKSFAGLPSPQTILLAMVAASYLVVASARVSKGIRV